MSVYSMTGYAQAMGEANAPGEPGMAIELRSVNSRFLDLAFRMPDEMRPIEPALRELLTASLRRGKVEVRVATRDSADSGLPHPHPEQLSALARLEGTVQGWLPKAQPLSVHEALQWCRAGTSAPRSDEAVIEIARKAVAALNEARRREGAKLVTILSQRIARLRELATEAEPLLPQVVERQQQRFLERWRAALETTGAAQSVPAEALQERALGEAAAFALRIDVAEELARLRAHLEEVDRLLAAGGEIGKRLDFLIQELHREANTLGSKSAALELTQISVEMKVAIEQMREQVQNIE
ncbi:YicC/YloC family endoribonuclease [Caldimonas sp. KR1-144]|uniref:YicC/YloC family endoribonuclease n=1 Tax=Caldimonas sp. KR1-144 TaxID=3400911 RepID=UPI003C09078A